MKANDPLAKLLKAAARAERMAAAESAELPFAMPTRVLAAVRSAAAEPFPFLPLFRRAFACAAAIAIISGSFLLQRNDTTDPFEYTVNYSLASAYLQ